jgi:hypothetical protein
MKQRKFKMSVFLAERNFWRTPKEAVNKENLRTAIRCYWKIERKGKLTWYDIVTRLQLQTIYQNRPNFEKTHKNKPYYNVFKDWILHPLRGKYEQTPAEIGRFDLPAMYQIKAHYLNLFTSEICSDLQNGLLILQPFHETQKEKRQRETVLMHEYGIKRKTAARLPKNIRAGFVELGLQPVKLGFADNSKFAQRALMIQAKHELQTAQHTLPPENAAQIENLLQMIENKIETLKIFE